MRGSEAADIRRPSEHADLRRVTPCIHDAILADGPHANPEDEATLDGFDVGQGFGMSGEWGKGGAVPGSIGLVPSEGTSYSG